MPFSDTGSTVGATAEPDDTHPYNSVWWAYTSSQDGTISVDTDGSSFSTTLTLWSGNNHPLSEAACDDSGRNSAVTVPVVAGQTYRIRVAGTFRNADAGDVTLNLTFNPPLENDDLADAVEILSVPYTTTGTNVGAIGEPNEVSSECSSSSGALNAVWWTYTATEEGKLTIDTDGSTFDLVLSVWTGTEHPLDSRGCTDSDDGGTLDVSPETTYHIRLSGYDFEDTGTIQLAVSFSLPDPVFVDDGAGGVNDGSSWTDAYTNLHDALADGAPEIWVAEGTYSNEGTAFTLPNGRRVYGGFFGSETTRSERDPRQHEAVLTGTADHVIYARSVGGTTILDGFTVRDGAAQGSGTEARGGGFFCDGRNTGANFDGFCTPKLRNLLFKNNTADDQGGALHLDGRDGGNASPSLSNVVFRGNSADDGGAISISAENLGFGSPDLQNVVFADNEAGRGGAIYSWAGLEGTARLTITNALFVNNTALSGGGALFNSQAGGAGGWATPTITNGTFVDNNADTGDVLFNYKLGEGEGEVTLHNAIFRSNNDDQTNASLFNQAGATTTLTDAVIDRVNDVCPSDVTCTRVVVDDPDFPNASDPDGADGRYGTADDGLRLAGYSPAVDAGNLLANTSATDVIGAPRVFGGAVDLGAYEYATHEGESDTPDVAAKTGFFKLGTTGATVLFTANTSTSGGLTGTLNEARPTGDGLPSNLAPKTWTVTETLDGTFVYNITFALADVDGIDAFSALQVYKSDDGGATWTAVPTLLHDAERQTLTAVGLTSFSQFAIGDETNPLPVEFAGFTAERSNAQVHLTWQTASETNNAGFHVERAIDDGAFADLHFVPGAGTSEEANTYRVADTRLPFTADRLTYRLRQVDHDGAATLSAPTTITVAPPEALILDAPFPNPVRGLATVRYALPTDAEVEIALYNLLGQRVALLVQGRQPAGRTEHRFDTGPLPSGVYFLRMHAPNQVRTQRLTVVQ